MILYVKHVWPPNHCRHVCDEDKENVLCVVSTAHNQLRPEILPILRMVLFSDSMLLYADNLEFCWYAIIIFFNRGGCPQQC